MISLELCEISLVFREIKTVVFTTTPQMHCAARENKIKNNLRFEKGIKNIETSVPNPDGYRKVQCRQDHYSFLLIPGSAAIIG